MATRAASESDLSDSKEKIAIVAPVLLMATMYPTFRLFEGLFGGRMGGHLSWFLGLVTYWLIWGVGYSLWMLGWPAIRELLRPRRPTLPIVLLTAFPVAMAAAAKLIPGMGYERYTLGVGLLLASTAVGNGVCEEVLWRGVYLELFRNRFFWRVVWASVWFGLWHVIPVSVHGPTLLELLPMVIGPLLVGFYLSFLAKKAESVWWPMIAHVSGGIVMIS